MHAIHGSSVERSLPVYTNIQRSNIQVERFLEHGPILRQIHAKALELILLIAGAKADFDTPLGQDIEHGNFFGELDRIAQRQHHHGSAKADVLGALGKEWDQQQRVGEKAVAGEMMLGSDNVVKAELVSPYGLLQRVLIRLLRRAHIWRLQQEENAEFHRQPPSIDSL